MTADDEAILDTPAPNGWTCSCAEKFATLRELRDHAQKSGGLLHGDEEPIHGEGCLARSAEEHEANMERRAR